MCNIAVYEVEMKAPALSVIVPTRERSDTLFHTIRTLVNQDYDDFEIIVSDNFSQDNTELVVESFADSRIRYINTGQRVSMSENWEFALQHARGNFITYLGDDDGFIPGALKGAMNILEKSELNAIVWGKAEYCWPDNIDESKRNSFSLKSRIPSLLLLNGEKKLRQVLKFRDGYNKLPCLYNGIVKKALVESLKNQALNKIFFNSISPDVFSAITLSMVVDDYIYTDYPFSVNGASRHSNGTSFMIQGISHSDSPHAKFTTENQIKYDQRLLMGPSVSICIMGEYLLAKHFLSKIIFPDVSWKRYVHSLINNAKGSLLSDEILLSAAYTVKQTELKIKVPEQVTSIQSRPEQQVGFCGDSFFFKAPIEMVKNIYDACELVSRMVPSAENLKQSTSIREIANRVRTFFYIELKNLYRST